MLKFKHFTKPVCEYTHGTVMKYRITGANRLRIEHYDGTCSCPVLENTRPIILTYHLTVVYTQEMAKTKSVSDSCICFSMR